MEQLLADRFICDRGRWFDLATAHPVIVRVSPAGSTRAQFAWSDRCATLSRLRHPLFNPLLDYGDAAARATFEAFAALPPFSAGPVVASHAATHAVRFLAAQAIVLERALADVVVRPVQPGGRRGRPFGVVLQHRSVLDTVGEALDAGGTGPVTITVSGPSRSGLSTVREAAARLARLAGYVPIGMAAARRWPELQRLSGRHVCVLSGEGASDESGMAAAWLTRLGAASARRHVHLRFVRSAEPPASALRLRPLGVAAMTGMVYVDPDFGPSVEELFAAARAADGWPGRFLAALRAEPFERGCARAASVHEASVPYVISRAVPFVRTPTPPGRSPSAVDRAERRAATLAAAGRHGAAVRLLGRAIRLLHARGAQDAAASCALRLAWILRSRGDGESAAQEVERARGMTQDPPLQIAAAIAAGILSTDDGRHVDAEAALRSAVAAAGALQRDDLASRAWLGLARTLLWQDRAGEALGAVRDGRLAAPPEVCCESLALAARIHVKICDVSAAVGAAAQAVERSLAASDARLQATAHRAMALALDLAGDPSGAAAHVHAGLHAAGAAHLPLAALRLRAVWLKTLRPGRDHETAQRLRDSLHKAVASRGLPHVVRAAIEEAREACAQVDRSSRARGVGRDAGVVVAELVDTAQRAPDDSAALTRVLDVVSERIQAASALLVAGSDGARVIAASGRPWRERPMCARRALETGQTVGIDAAAQPPEAAQPVKYAGNTVAAIACRWPAGSSVDPMATALYLGAAALAVSTHVQAVLEVRETLPHTSWGDLLGESPAASDLRESVQRAARAPFPVLIEGESGSGKELVARAVHRLGVRRDRRFCAINCAAITDELVEAELFGHARGAFTGAAAERAGLFEDADGGSMFLDEVGELSARAQAKLLRVLQDGEVRRVGENFPRRVDVRVIAATNRRLEDEVAAGRFRADLRFRLDVVRIVVPPLRDRATDIPMLAAHFWQDASSRVGSRATLAPEALAALSRYDWPGNVRELQNAIASMAVHAPRRGKVGPAMLPARLAASAPLATGSFEAARAEFDRRFVRAALAQTGGHRARAARLLGVSRQGLAKMLRRLGIEAG